MIRILTDSAADLTAAEAARPGVTVIPLQVLFADGTSARDGVDISGDEYYARLKTEPKLPRTSQPSPETFMEFFEQARAAGDEVLAILIASNLSGTFQCAKLAAETCEFTAVRFVDSRTASQGEALLVREALRRREAGETLDEIADAIEELKGRIRILGVVDSLRHLHKGGRLPAAVALVGGALGIKPVLHVDDEGHLIAMEKVRGRRASLDALLKHYEATVSDKNETVFISHGDCAADCAYVIDKLKALGVKEIYQGDIGPVIGAHSGPGTVALFWVGTKR